MLARVALLRGVNVGGKTTVSMARLKEVFEGLGLRGVRTYINSGNVVFSAGDKSPARLGTRITAAIASELGLEVAVVLRDRDEFDRVLAVLPAGWNNDDKYRSEVYFSDRFRTPDDLGLLPLTPGIEEVLFAPGAILCRIPRAKLTRSRLTRLVGTDLYRSMTARNCNTVRKLGQLLHAIEP